MNYSLQLMPSPATNFFPNNFDLDEYDERHLHNERSFSEFTHHEPLTENINNELSLTNTNSLNLRQKETMICPECKNGNLILYHLNFEEGILICTEEQRKRKKK